MNALHPPSQTWNLELETWNLPRQRSGYTLAEMLVVMTIMLMLVAITLPAVKNLMQDGNVREASRLLNSYLAMAKARALQTGRPCGVMMLCELPLGMQDPPSATPNIPLWPTKQITKMYLAEVPPPYAGGTVGAKGRIMYSLNVGAPPGTIEFHPLTGGGGIFGIDTSEQAILGSLILDGETFIVRFDYKGAWFVCQRVGSLLVYQQPGTKPIGTTSAGSPTPIPPAMNILPNTATSPYTSTLPGFTYQILRLPRRIGNPLELSAGTCIDLAYSGIGSMNMPSNTVRYGMYPANPATPNSTPAANFPGLFPGSPPAAQSLQYLTVMFTPGGGIDSVFLNNWFFTPSTTVHFLVGRTDKMNAPLGTSSTNPTQLNMYDPTASNLSDPQSVWVSVARSTGNVVTSDNFPPPVSAATSSSMVVVGGGTQQTIAPNTDAGQVTFLSFCRQLATNREQSKAQ